MADLTSKERLSREEIIRLMLRYHFRHPVKSELGDLMQECYALGRASAHETENSDG